MVCVGCLVGYSIAVMRSSFHDDSMLTFDIRLPGNHNTVFSLFQMAVATGIHLDTGETHASCQLSLQAITTIPKEALLWVQAKSWLQLQHSFQRLGPGALDLVSTHFNLRKWPDF